MDQEIGALDISRTIIKHITLNMMIDAEASVKIMILGNHAGMAEIR
jgi:hypothetical protein